MAINYLLQETDDISYWTVDYLYWSESYMPDVFGTYYTEIVEIELELNKVVTFELQLNKVIAIELELNKVIETDDYDELKEA